MDWSPLLISMKTSLSATACALSLGILAAWGIRGLGGRLKAILDVLFTLPMILPPTVLGFGLLLLLGRNGPIGRAFLSIGVRIVFSWGATVIAATVVAFPLVYRTVRASFEQIDSAILNAARTLGLSERSIFCRIMVPMSLPGIVAGAVLAFARALGEFGATLMVAGNIPGRTSTIPIAIYFASEGGDDGRALAWVLIIVAISFTVILAMNWAGGRGRR
ncbi:MAG TPA: molybdate ABC transporter permease subunit [Treponemataceae bacterium]|nr:molybdate ABC transporter permease subunit [Treponemataceae bacterium]HPS45375.1 molybdate ABC transporter permease subunit [Treponemataceae bacterium]